MTQQDSLATNLNSENRVSVSKEKEPRTRKGEKWNQTWNNLELVEYTPHQSLECNQRIPSLTNTLLPASIYESHLRKTHI